MTDQASAEREGLLHVSNIRAWMLAAPFTQCDEWKSYVDHMLDALAGAAPQPAVPADVREALDEQWVTDNGDGSVTLDTYAGWSRDKLKQRCRELCRAVDKWQFAAMHAATNGSNSIEQVQEPYRSHVANMIDAYSDDDAALPSAGQQKEG